jgi:hypothetical protein
VVKNVVGFLGNFQRSGVELQIELVDVDTVDIVIEVERVVLIIVLVGLPREPSQVTPAHLRPAAIPPPTRRAPHPPHSTH